MSQENVEIVRAAFDAWNAGDMDALRELYDPDVDRCAPIEGWPEPGPFVGREVVMRWFAQPARPGTPTPLELASDFIEVGDRVAVRQIWRGAGRGPEANMGDDDRLHGARWPASSTWSSSGITRRPSKPWGCRSKTLTPTPEPAGYCAGDVAGERGGRREPPRGVERGRHGRVIVALHAERRLPPIGGFPEAGHVSRGARRILRSLRVNRRDLRRASIARPMESSSKRATSRCRVDRDTVGAGNASR